MALTRPEPACGRPLEEVVADCVDAGATAIQLRDKAATASALAATASRLLEITEPAGALLIVNDRIDVALAAGADGAHLGPSDLPVAAARKIAPPGFIIGYSTDDPAAARAAASDGADYFGVGAVFGTRSKPGLERERVGPGRVADVLRAARRPCTGIGGITPANAATVLATGTGVAVLSAIMDADDPGAVVASLRDLASR